MGTERPSPVRLKARQKRRAFETLARDRLAALCDRFELGVADRRVNASFVDALVRQRRVPLVEVLGHLTRNELKAICEELGLDPTGREKRLLVDRILAGPPDAGEKEEADEAPPEAATAAARLRPRDKRIALLELSRDRLGEITDALQVPVGDRRARRSYVDALVRSRSVDFREVLSACTRAELKAMCAALGLSTVGREKVVLVERIVGPASDDVDIGTGDDEAIAQAERSDPATPPEPTESVQMVASAETRRPATPATGGPGQEPIDLPLVHRAIAAGILEGKSALVVAPTATGKSTIGRMLVSRTVERATGGLRAAYLVPFRALAWELFEQIADSVARIAPRARVQIATGDATDPVEPERADVLVATYESFQALSMAGRLRPAVVVVDEVHLLADETRGPPLEMLLSSLRTDPDVQLCALSAVVQDPAPLAAWLRAEVVPGGPEDRPVPVTFGVEESAELDDALLRQVDAASRDGESVLVFCTSKATAQRVARQLGEIVEPHLGRAERESLYQLGYDLQLADAELGTGTLGELVKSGVAYHHAGLVRGARARIEAAYRERIVRVIACTPTLAAGVNLPAELVLLRDVFRREARRGRYLSVMIPTSEVLNMLGRAGRPGQATSGRGVVLVKKASLDDDERSRLRRALDRGTGEPVRSRMPDRFEWLMRFALREATARGEITEGRLKAALEQTLWHAEDPGPIELDRPLVEDLMEDIPSFDRAADVTLLEHEAQPDGVSGTVGSGDRRYEVAIRLTGLECDCPARSRWHRDKVCKHLARAIHTLLFDPTVGSDARERAMYACLHLFRRTLDLGTKLREALDILVSWELLARTAVGLRPTTAGEVAAYTGLDLLLVRDGYHRIAATPAEVSPRDVALWTVDDFFGDAGERDRWHAALGPWLDERPQKEITLPTRYRGQFESGLDRLGSVAVLYGRVARSLGKPRLAEAAEAARACLRHGVEPDAVPLASLNIPRLRRGNCRYLIERHGIRNVDDLARAIPAQLADATRVLSPAQCRLWVDRAAEICRARAQIDASPPAERTAGLDDLLARFRVEAIALEPR